MRAARFSQRAKFRQTMRFRPLRHRRVRLLAVPTREDGIIRKLMRSPLTIARWVTDLGKVQMRAVGIAVVLGGAASLAAAQVPESVRACAHESDGAQRLACYDKEMTRLMAPAAAHETAPSTAVGAPKPAPAQEFGLTEERLRKLNAKEGYAEPQTLTAHIAKVAQLPYGRRRLTLDNAQVWEQTEEDWGFNPQSGAAATITRGAFGGFWMATDGHPQVRVKRIR